MKFFSYTLLVLMWVNFSACKIERQDDSSAKTIITDSVGNELGNVAVTFLTFSNKLELSSSEVYTRMECGDHRPMLSRIDDMHYELQPESVYHSLRKVQPGDHATCRYQNATNEAMLFRDKPLAIKVKYPRQYSSSPPPMIRFTSGMGIRVDRNKFNSLFHGRCVDFAQSGDGLLYCKTTDSHDGRVIWLALIAPEHSSYVPITTGNVGGKVYDVAQLSGKGGKMLNQGVAQSSAQSAAQAPGKSVGKGVAQVPAQIPSKGGKGSMVGQHSFASPVGGRIEMQITLPYVSTSSIPLAVNVPHFNFELLARLHSPGGGIFVEEPSDHSPYGVDYGDELEQREITAIVEAPTTDPDNPGKPETLRFTIKSTESRPAEGRWSGVGKAALGIGGIAAGVVLWPIGLAATATAATTLGAVGVVGALASPFAMGGFLTGKGVQDLLKWKKTALSQGSFMDFLVNSNADICPPVYGRSFTLTEKDRYITLKAERRGVKWWNIGEIKAVPRVRIGTNRWTVVTAGKGAFKVLLCRKELENHCLEPTKSMYSESVLTRISECRKLGNENKLYGKFGSN